MSNLLKNDFNIQKIATYLIKNMLNYNKIDLNKIKAQFSLDDFEVRKALIKLYQDNKIFGKIQSDSDGRTYLVFTLDEIQKKQLKLEDIIDWDLEQFRLIGVTEQDELRVENLRHLMSNVVQKKENKLEISTSRLREIDQKDLISIEMTVKIIGIKTVTIIGIINSSDYPATEGKIRLIYDNNLTIKPQFDEYPFERKSGEISIKINELPAKSTKTLRLYVYDILNRQFHINGFFQFRNNKYTIRLIKLEEINVNFNIPEIKPLQGNINDIKAIMRNPEYFKRMQGVGCPNLDCQSMVLPLFHEIMERYHFSNILKNDKPVPMWFYLGTIESPDGPLEVLAIPQIKNNFFALYVSCKNKDLVATLIHNLVLDFQQHIINRKFYPNDYKLIDLNCVNCQKVLETFPPQSTEIKCSKCGYSQLVW
ncbi:hypothetical protein [Candidatus Harpocratesius sp.]